MPKSVTFVAHGLNGGGAEMCMLRLAEELCQRGIDVRIAVLWKTGRLAEALPEGVPVDEIGGGRLSCIPRLAVYLARHRSDAIIAFMTYANVVAILAQALSLSLRKIVITEHTVYSHSIRIRGGITKLFYRAAPYTYRWTGAIICVSQGVKADLAKSLRLPMSRMTTIYNPVLTDALIAAANQPPDHPWLADKSVPVILSVGRLDKLKNYPLLLQAFAQLRRKVECRLVILGEGVLLDELWAEARALGVGSDVDFAGFRRNPMSFMRKADLFVLSSDFEGLSNVLIEAMAVGCPVVSTDAPHGPREVLEDGRLGRLVPVGDVGGLARAMEEALHDPGDVTARKQRAASFSVSASADQYLRAAGL